MKSLRVLVFRVAGVINRYDALDLAEDIRLSIGQDRLVLVVGRGQGLDHRGVSSSVRGEKDDEVQEGQGEASSVGGS